MLVRWETAVDVFRMTRQSSTQTTQLTIGLQRQPVSLTLLEKLLQCKLKQRQGIILSMEFQENSIYQIALKKQLYIGLNSRLLDGGAQFLVIHRQDADLIGLDQAGQIAIAH